MGMRNIVGQGSTPFFAVSRRDLNFIRDGVYNSSCIRGLSLYFFLGTAPLREMSTKLEGGTRLGLSIGNFLEHDHRVLPWQAWIKIAHAAFLVFLLQHAGSLPRVGPA